MALNAAALSKRVKQRYGKSEVVTQLLSHSIMAKLKQLPGRKCTALGSNCAKRTLIEPTQSLRCTLTFIFVFRYDCNIKYIIDIVQLSFSNVQVRVDRPQCFTATNSRKKIRKILAYCLYFMHY